MTFVGVDYQGLWKLLQQLLDNLASALDRDAFMDECLDILIDLLGADRGVIFLADSDGCTYVVNARGRNRSLGPKERKEVSKTIVREAQDTDQCVVWGLDQDCPMTESTTSLNIAVFQQGKRV